MQLKKSMERFIPVKQGLLIAVAAAFAIACGGAAQSGGGDSVAKSTPPDKTVATPAAGDFSLKDVDGKTHTLSDYLGSRVIVISYFATWCEPCRAELLELERLYKYYKDRKLLILAVAMDLPETRGDVRPLAKQQQLTFPVLLDEELKAADLFNPERQAPFSVVIDMNKNRIWSHMGYVPGDEKKLEAVITAALAENSNAN